jgi:hypothetical protein
MLYFLHHAAFPSPNQKVFFLRMHIKILKRLTCVWPRLNIFLLSKNHLPGVALLCYFARRNLDMRWGDVKDDKIAADSSARCFSKDLVTIINETRLYDKEDLIHVEKSW